MVHCSYAFTRIERCRHDASKTLAVKIISWVYMLGLVAFLFVAIYAFNPIIADEKEKRLRIEDSRIEEWVHTSRTSRG